MKIIKLLSLTISAAIILLTSCNKVTSKNAKLNNEIDSVSYALGVNIGTSLKNGPNIDDIDLSILTQALKDIFEDKDTKMTYRESNQYLSDYSQKMYMKEAQDNLAEGQAFLEENESKPGIITTESGLQYEVLVEGNGPKPEPGDSVKAIYTGTLIDGTVFDSSEKHGGQPFTFVTGQGRVYKAWEEIIPMMSVGSKYKIYSPTHLAAGTNVRRGGPVGPNMVLIFEIELLDIK